MTHAQSGERLDLGAAGFQADPYGALATVRDSGDGVQLLDDMGAWAVLRHTDVSAVFRDATRFSARWFGRVGPDRGAQSERAEALMRGNLLFYDPPVHTRLRALVSRAFTPRAVERLRSAVAARAAELVGEIGPGDRVDIVERFALPLAIDAIAELLGVPAGDRAQFARWSDAATLLLAPMLPPDKRKAAVAEATTFVEYIREVVRARRRSGGDDLVSGLVTAEVDGERLDEPEVVQLVQLLLVAGNETTRSLLASAVKLLVEHPAELARVRADAELVAPMIEEVLRYEPSIGFTFRIALEEVQFGSTRVPAGAPVLLSIAAANRDPREFDAPERFDVSRKPNRHVSFAAGAHFCLGAPLARMEAQVALPLVFERMGLTPRFAEEPAYAQEALARGLPRLVVEL